jgi:hypothetical protein
MEYLKHLERVPLNLVTAPFILSIIVPLVVTDLWVEIYHRISFPLYRIAYVKRSAHIRIDGHKLRYLSPLQKVFCMYCGYANGVIGYWGAIAGESEKYWCGIMHKSGDGFIPPAHHADFVPYGDEEAFRKKYPRQ